MGLLERITAEVPMRTIPLNRGLFALIDAADYGVVSRHRWTFDGRYAVRYERRGEQRRKVYMHRELLSGVASVDHANLDTLDNRRANLRPATQGQQNANTPKRSDGLSSRFKGVSRDRRPLRKPWVAQIRVNGKGRWLGRFATEADAALAYSAAACEAYGPFARPASR